MKKVKWIYILVGILIVVGFLSILVFCFIFFGDSDSLKIIIFSFINIFINKV